MLNYCTYFDSRYLSRGLTMIRSLKAADPSCRIFVLCLDETCRGILREMRLTGVSLVRLEDFEDPELLKAKTNRTLVEYYWTCTPSWILYCLRHFSLERCTYVDADVFFFSDPRPLVEECGTDAALITEHRFSPAYAEYAVNGIYNVQFMTFRAETRGWEILEWWRAACNQWCYYRLEDGKLGDQKYLDDWPTRFRGVHVLQNPGGAMGPWNVQQYEFSGPRAAHQVPLRARLKVGGPDFPVVFYHFHNFRMYPGGYARSIFYEIAEAAWDALYRPYAAAVAAVMDELVRRDFRLCNNGLAPEDEPVAVVIAALENSRQNRCDPFLVYDRRRFARYAGWRGIILKAQQRWRALREGRPCRPRASQERGKVSPAVATEVGSR